MLNDKTLVSETLSNFFIDNPEEGFHTKDLASILKINYNTLRRELVYMHKSGLIEYISPKKWRLKK